MKFKIHSHRYAEDILESKYKNDWNDLKDLISNISEQKIMKLVSEGYKQREIADIMKEKPNTIAAIISRANRKLKKCMQDN